MRLVAGGYEAAEAAAIRHAHENQQTYVSPYNDGQVIAGQGTLALEVLRELPEPPTAWIVPVGGGGLISGVGLALETVSPRPRLIGVQAAASAFMHALYHRGSQEGVEDLPTLADGLAGALEAGSVTVPLVRRWVDDLLLVEEDEIAAAMAFAARTYGETIEGSAAAALAAALTGRVDGPALVVISGGNVQPETHAAVLAGSEPA